MAEEVNRAWKDQYMLRFPDGMRERLKEEAGKSGRSLNAEIIHRLANSLENPKFADFAIGLNDEDLDFALMVAAEYSGRSLRDEMIYRLKQSLAPQISLIEELEQQARTATKRYESVMRLLMQLTPEERRLLEERAELAEIARKIPISSKSIGKFVKLNPIGNRGRFTLKVPKSDYGPIFGETTSEQFKGLLEEVKRIED